MAVIVRRVSSETYDVSFREYLAVYAPYVMTDPSFQANDEDGRWTPEEQSSFLTSVVSNMAPSKFIFAEVNSCLEYHKEESEDSIIYKIFMPSKNEIIRTLVPKYINVQIWQYLLESNASEQAARMLAMENATENAGEMISDLSLEYNKARQAAITTEIIEIVSGANALEA